MTIKKIRSFIDHHIQLVVAIQLSVVIGLWALSNLIPQLRDWLLTQSIFNIIIIVMLTDVLIRLAELSGDETSRVSIFRDEPRAYPALRDHIERRRPKRADLIEYSTATIHDLLENLKDSHTALRILICNPDHAVNDFQRDRITDRIRDLITLTFREYHTVEVRMYRLPASLRGRLIDDDYVTVGWHTYGHGDAGLSGHTNPMVSCRTDNEQGRAIRDMFTEAFNRLWSDDTTTVLISPGPHVNLDAVNELNSRRDIAVRLHITSSNVRPGVPRLIEPTEG
jgi:hypothetical protein